MSLGGFLHDFQRQLREGAPSDRCVLCGSTTALLHPVENAWACSRCHTSAWTRSRVGEDAYCELLDTIDPGAEQ